MTNWGESGNIGTIQVELVRIGTYVQVEGKTYQIMASRTNQEDLGGTGKDPQISTDYQLLPVSDEGDDLSGPDNPVIWREGNRIVII